MIGQADLKKEKPVAMANLLIIIGPRSGFVYICILFHLAIIIFTLNDLQFFKMINKTTFISNQIIHCFIHKSYLERTGIGRLT